MEEYQLETLLESRGRNEEEASREFLQLKNRMLFEKKNYENVSLPLKNPLVFNPLEYFPETSALERRKIFFKSLNFGDVFYLRVLKEQPDCYKLLALDKYSKGYMKINDLSIVMELPKFPQELKHLRPFPFHFVIAALSACDVKERTLCVTLDASILKKEFKTVQLGPLYGSYQAHYHGEVSLGKSYADDLCMTGEMSMHKQLQGFSQVQKVSLSWCELAVSSFNNKDLDSTLDFLKQALLVWDENYKALLLAIKCCIEKCDGGNAFVYAEKAFKLYLKSSFPKETLFELLLNVSHLNSFLKNKCFAFEAFKMAKIVDQRNEKAFRIYNQILKQCEN